MTENETFEAGLPIGEQEFDCSEVMRTFDPAAAKTWPSHDGPHRAEEDYFHLEALLEIAAMQLPQDKADVVYRCWRAYSAGYRGSHCMTVGISALDYWYARGRAARKLMVVEVTS